MDEKEIPLSLTELEKITGESRFKLSKLVKDHDNGLRIWNPNGQRKYYPSQIRFFLDNPYELRAPDPEGYDFEILDGDISGEKPEQPAFIQKQHDEQAPSFRGRVYFEIVRQGQALGEWEEEPDQAGLKSAYGPGQFKVFKRNGKTDQIISCTLHSIGESAERSDIENKVNELLKIKDLTASLLPAGDTGNLLLAMLKMTQDQNTALLNVIMNRAANNGNGHAPADFLDQLLKFEKARKIFRGDGDVGDDPGEGSAISQIVSAVAKELIPRLLPAAPGAGPGPGGAVFVPGDQSGIAAGPVRVVAAPGPLQTNTGTAPKTPSFRVVGGGK